MGIVTDVDGNNIKARGARARARRPGAKISPQWRRRRCAMIVSARRALGPALGATTTRAVRVGRARSGRVDGLRLVATRSWLARRRLLLEPPDALPDEASGEPPPDPRGDVARARADLRRFKSALRGRVRRARRGGRRAAAAAANQAEVRRGPRRCSGDS